MSSARTPLPTLNERDTEQVRSSEGCRHSRLGPCTLQSLLPPLLSSCPGCQPASSSCPVICLSAPHSPLRVLSWDPPPPGCGLHTCLSADPPCPLAGLPRSSVLPPQLPLLFPFFSGALLVFLHPRLQQPPSAQRVAPRDLLQVVVHLFLCLPSLVSPPPAPALPAPGCPPQGPCPGMCSQPLSPVQFPSFVSVFFFFYPASSCSKSCSPSCLQPTSSTLLTFPNRSPTLCSSLSLLFSSSSPCLPRAGMCCFRVSPTAVMRILFPQVVFGVPALAPFSLWIPHALSPRGFGFSIARPPVSHC